MWDLGQDDYDYLWNITKKVAVHLRSSMNVERVGVVVKGFEVPHAHIHLIPVNSNEGVDFDPTPPPPQADDNELATVAERIRM